MRYRNSNIRRRLHRRAATVIMEAVRLREEAGAAVAPVAVAQAAPGNETGVKKETRPLFKTGFAFLKVKKPNSTLTSFNSLCADPHRH